MAERREHGLKAIKLPKFFGSSTFKIVLSVFLFYLIGSSAAVLYYCHYYSKVISRKLAGEVFKNTAQIYAAPYRIYPGQKLSADDAVARLQRAGFEPADKGGSEDGAYQLSGARLTIRPKLGDALRLDFRKT